MRVHGGALRRVINEADDGRRVGERTLRPFPSSASPRSWERSRLRVPLDCHDALSRSTAKILAALTRLLLFVNARYLHAPTNAASGAKVQQQNASNLPFQRIVVSKDERFRRVIAIGCDGAVYAAGPFATSLDALASAFVHFRARRAKAIVPLLTVAQALLLAAITWGMDLQELPRPSSTLADLVAMGLVEARQCRDGSCAAEVTQLGQDVFSTLKFMREVDRG